MRPVVPVATGRGAARGGQHAWSPSQPSPLHSTALPLPQGPHLCIQHTSTCCNTRHVHWDDAQALHAHWLMCCRTIHTSDSMQTLSSLFSRKNGSATVSCHAQLTYHQLTSPLSIPHSVFRVYHIYNQILCRVNSVRLPEMIV